MKQVVFSLIIMLGTTAIASAQPVKTNKPPRAKDTIPPPAANPRTDTIKLDNREIYKWSNGQSSTPSGEEATSSNGSSYAALKKDTAKVLPRGRQ